MAPRSLKRSLMALTVLGASGVAFACTGQSQPSAAHAEADFDAVAAMRGLEYARQNCSICHAVEGGGQASPKAGAPAFEDIANAPGMDVTALNVWLHSAHPSMPNLAVDPDHIEDLSAYIETLRRGKTRG